MKDKETQRNKFVANLQKVSKKAAALQKKIEKSAAKRGITVDQMYELMEKAAKEITL